MSQGLSVPEMAFCGMLGAVACKMLGPCLPGHPACHILIYSREKLAGRMCAACQVCCECKSHQGARGVRGKSSEGDCVSMTCCSVLQRGQQRHPRAWQVSAGVPRCGHPAESDLPGSGESSRACKRPSLPRNVLCASRAHVCSSLCRPLRVRQS